MMRFNCPSCGMGVSAPEEDAGRSTRCRRCNNPIVVPQPVTTRLPSSEAGSGVSIQRRGEPVEPQEQEPEVQESLYLDREPWFYGYLEKYAKILQLIGYVSAAGAAMRLAVDAARNLRAMKKALEATATQTVGR